jgi:hypothetical protein
VRAGLSGVNTSGDSGGTGGGGTGGGTGGGGSGSSGPRDLPQGNGTGSVPLGPDGKPLNPLIDAQDDERKAIGAAQAGEQIRPTSAGVRPGEPDADLPLPLIAVLALAAIAGLAAGAVGVKQIVTGRTA